MPPKRTQQMIRDGVYPVERIVATRQANGRQEFLLRYVGYGPADDTWEPRVNLSDDLYEGWLAEQADDEEEEEEEEEEEDDEEDEDEDEEEAKEGAAVHPGDVAPDGQWKGYATLPAAQVEADLAERQRRNGFGAPNQETDGAAPSGRKRRRTATPDVPAAPAKSAPRGRPGRRTNRPAKSKRQAEVVLDDEDVEMADATSEVSATTAPAPEAATDNHADDDALDVDEAEQTDEVKQKAKLAVPKQMPNPYLNVRDDDDAGECNDPYAAVLGAVSHCRSVRRCQAATHTDPNMRTCNDCLNATLATMTEEQQDTAEHGAFRTMCKWHSRQARTAMCGCLDKMYCCSCVISLVDDLMEANKTADSDSPPELGECPWCATLLDGTEKVQVCILCMGRRLLE